MLGEVIVHGQDTARTLLDQGKGHAEVAQGRGCRVGLALADRGLALVEIARRDSGEGQSFAHPLTRLFA